MNKNIKTKNKTIVLHIITIIISFSHFFLHYVAVFMLIVEEDIDKKLNS